MLLIFLLCGAVNKAHRSRLWYHINMSTNMVDLFGILKKFMWMIKQNHLTINHMAYVVVVTGGVI